MDANDNTRTDVPEDVVVLGIATSETKGIGKGLESNGGDLMPGLSDQ